MEVVWPERVFFPRKRQKGAGCRPLLEDVGSTTGDGVVDEKQETQNLLVVIFSYFLKSSDPVEAKYLRGSDDPSFPVP